MKKQITYYLGLFFLVLLIISASILIVMWSTPLFHLNLALFRLNETVDLSVAQVMSEYHHLIAYLNFPWIEILNFRYFPMSDSAAFHFFEVKQLFQLNIIIFFISFIVSNLFLYKLYKHRMLWRLWRPFLLLSWGPLVIIILLFFNFDDLFILFHKIVFNNDAWLFNPQTDPIILVLNDSFFMLCFILVFILIQLGMLLFFFIGKTTLKKDSTYK